MAKHPLRRLSAILLTSGLLFGAFSFERSSIGSDPASVPNADRELLLRISQTFEEVARKAMPAVVSINSVKSAVPEHQAAQFNPFNPFGGPDGEMPWDPESPEADEELPKAMGIGTGILIRNDGTILTSYHVVENADYVTVTVDEKTKLHAEVIGADPKTDLAIVRILPDEKLPGPVKSLKDLPTLQFGNSDSVKVGDWAIAIGSPFGLARSVSFGIISAKGRGQMGVLDIEDFIQTDASINPGSSGGPLLNLRGEVIGIATAIFSQNGGFAGIGFAVPSKMAADTVDELITKGHVTRGWAGISAQDLDPELSEYFKTDRNAGALVTQVKPGGPAQGARLQPGDVVKKFDQQAIQNSGHFKRLVERRRPGDEIPLEVTRNHREVKLSMKLGEDPAVREQAAQARQKAGKAPAGQKKTKAGQPLGVAVEEIPPEILRYLGGKVKNGVIIVSVQPGTAAFDVGLSPGDIVMKVNETDIRTKRDFHKTLNKVRKDTVALFYIQRGDEERLFIGVRS